MKTLFVNACVRKESRTLELAKYLLNRLEGEVTQINLQQENIEPLKEETLAKREELLRKQKFEDVSFRYARTFAEADEIVIAAPFWDLSFPALLKIYLENVTVSGITFTYEDGVPKGLCHAKRLFYVTTAGGPIFADFGYSYVKTLAESFYGIKKTICYKAQNLDVDGVDVDTVLMQAREQMKNTLE